MSSATNSNQVKKKKRLPKANLKYADSDIHKDRIFVSGFPVQAQGRDIWNFFEQFGQVTDVYLLRRYYSHVSKGKCFVSFKESSVVDHILSLCDGDSAVVYKRRELNITRAYSAEKQQVSAAGDIVNGGRTAIASTSTSSYTMEPVSEQNMAFSVASNREIDGEVDVNINDVLPNSCLMQILTMLTLAEQLEYMKVCKYWTELIKSILMLNKEIIIPEAATTLDAKLIDRYILTRNGMNKALSLCPSLTVLDVSKAKTFDVFHLRFVNIVPQYCKQLTVLKLPKCIGKLLTHESIKLVKGLKCLEELEMPNCSLTDKFLYSLFATCKRLCMLDIEDSGDITSKPFINIPVNLEKLNIKACRSVGAKIFDNMLPKCKDTLRYLSAEQCQALTPSCLETICKFSNLEHLNLSGFLEWECPEEDQMRCLSNLKHLKVLNLADTACIHDQDIADIVTGCTLLENLNISGNFACLTQHGIIKLKNAKSLQKLDLSYQANVDDDCLEALANLPKLQHLAIMRCSSMSNSGLSFLALLSTSLLELDISGNWQLEQDLGVLTQFADTSENRPGKLSIYFGLSGLSKAYSLLEENELKKLENLEKFQLYPYTNHSRYCFEDSDDLFFDEDSDGQSDLFSDYDPYEFGDFADIEMVPHFDDHDFGFDTYEKYFVNNDTDDSDGEPPLFWW